jgi:DNA-binding CsgD family transcriptional regulator
VSDQEIATDPFYTEFLARHGLRWRVAIGVAPHPHIAVAISVQRSLNKPAFTDEELRVATRLGRHAEKSLRLSIKLLDTQLTNTGLGEALTRIGIGVFALDSLGRVVFANPAAERLCGGSIDIVQTRLRIGSAAERVAIDDAIMHTLRAEAADLLADPKPILVPRAASERPLIVYLLPIGASAAATEQFLTHTRAIVLVIDSQSDEPADPAVVRDVLGLTLGEARVAALIGSGLSPRDAGERLGISEETARTTLKRVFSKVGVSRQSALAALLSKLVLR